ncbi:hypothetical protein SpCBS45565_g02881 [Spizellomyces sp. 'palustris']|nr:hypothetical protein SpCBS45565_g02881 [Spizellomyces sp. 'palustris']
MTTVVENPLYRTGFGLLVVGCAVASYYFREANAGDDQADNNANPRNTELDDGLGDIPSPISSSKEAALFDKFKRNWLLVYSLVMMADWLQGPATYPLYISYGYDLSEIAILFVVGFLSSAVFGTVIGSVADKIGRKVVCLMFCVIYAASCFTKLSSNFMTLLLGRVLGGIATSLLFSVFEAWMVSEHHSRGFREALLSDTFSWSTFLNGLVAILSGILGNFLSDKWGVVAPFMGSIFFLCLAFFVVQATWKENYGSGKPGANKSSISEAVKSIWHGVDILAVGVMQCFFESAMYTFVFLWQPVLTAKASGYGAQVPYGIVFAAFMVSIMLGSVIFKVLLRHGWRHEDVAWVTFAVAAVSLFIPVIASDEFTLFVSFNIFEMCCGLYFPSLGTLRSKLVPEETRSTIMNVFRVPLNLIVVVALSNVKSVNTSTLFAICAALVGVSMLFARRLALRAGKARNGRPPATVVWDGSEDKSAEIERLNTVKT